MLELFHKHEDNFTKIDIVKRDSAEKKKEEEIEIELNTLLKKIKNEKIPQEKLNIKQYILDELHNILYVLKRLHFEIEKIDKGEISLIEHEDVGKVINSVNYYLNKLNKDISYAEFKLEELKQKHKELKSSKKAGKDLKKIDILFNDLETKLEIIKRYNKNLPF